MINLPDNITQTFKDGQFNARQSAGEFKGISTDMGTETTIIKDSKSDSGIVGLTRRKSALVRWSLTRHIMGEFSSAIDSRLPTLSEDHLTPSSNTRDQNGKSAIKRDENAVFKIFNHIQENMNNPFDTSKHVNHDLLNIGTGMHASNEIQDSLLHAVEKGRKQTEIFIASVLSSTKSKGFYDPIKKSRLKTFSSMSTKTTTCKPNYLININPELVLRRALAMSEMRNNVSMDEVPPGHFTSSSTFSR